MEEEEERNVAAAASTTATANGRQKSRSRGVESKQQSQVEATRKQMKMPFDADSCEMEEEFNEGQSSNIVASAGQSASIVAAVSYNINEQRGTEMSKGLVSKTVKKGTGRHSHGSGSKQYANTHEEDSQSEDEEAEGEGEGEDVNVRDVEKEEEEYVNDCGDDEEDRISRFRLRKRFEQAQLAAAVKQQQLQQQQQLLSSNTTTITAGVKGVEAESVVSGDGVKNSLFAVYRTFFSLAAFEKEDKRSVSGSSQTLTTTTTTTTTTTLSINYRNAELADKQLAALILERPQKQPDEFAALTRLFIDLSGNYGGILTSKALQHCLKYLTGLNELSINFSNQFLWMDFMYFGRTLQTYQTNLRSLHLNLKQILFILKQWDSSTVMRIKQ